MPFSEDELKDLLCLSAITYRGYTAGDFHDANVKSAIVEGLRDYVGDRFELVWGPDRYESPLSVYDDSLMFVARQRGAGRPRYVIAIRGTNPISAFDWVLGDFWVSRPVPWPHDESGRSMLSMSTAIGLIMLQHMRSSAPGSLVDEIKERIAEGAAALEDRARRAVQKLRDLTESVRSRVQIDARRATDADLTSWVREAVEALPQLGKCLADSAHQELFGDLEARVKLASQSKSGPDLAQFLKGVVAREGDLDIVVTGHSKGGALAPALALWLAETRAEWDPEQRATLHCAAFAGPSPGNGAFAQRFDAAFGDHFVRVINEHDIVPRAWYPDTLGEIGDLYQPVPSCPKLLADLFRAISRDIKELGYEHLAGTTTTLHPDLNAKADTFIAQVIHQHLDGYLEAYDLPWRTKDFFHPLT